MKATAMTTQTNKSVEVMVSTERNPLAVFLSSQAPSSQYTYKYDLKGISILLGYPDPFTCPWQALRFQHTQAIRTVLTTIANTRTGKCLALVTVNRKLSALRGVLKTAWRLGQMNAEDYFRAVDVQNVKGETLPAGRELNNVEVTGLMEVCSSDLTTAGARDAAIIALMYSCGLRRNEVCSLDLNDYDPSNNKLVVRGKRRKERTAYLVNEAALAMMDWLKIRGDWAGALFPSYNSHFGWLGHKRITGQAIYNMLDKRGRQAGVAKFSPHDMRRTFVSDLLDAGVDISTVSKMAGHASVTTTARYDKRPEETKRKAAELLHVSYHARSYSEK